MLPIWSLSNHTSTDHKVMILGTEGVSEHPTHQAQHLMALPDSADYIYVRNAENLHPAIAEEISEVREKKGTSVLSYADFAVADADWLLLKNEHMDAGEPIDLESEEGLGLCRQFFKEHAAKQLALCDQYGFEGVVVSYLGDNSTEENRICQEGFMEAVKQWKTSHSDCPLFIRGNVNRITDKELCNQSKYLILVLDGVKGAYGVQQLIKNKTGNYPEFQNKVVLGLSVPSLEEPEQQGESPRSAAELIFSDEMKPSPVFKATILGLSVQNAEDDYYNETFYADSDKAKSIYFGSYVNICRSIGCLNANKND